MPKKHTIIPGTRYGMLTVLKDLGLINKYTMILVRCDCGEERKVRYSGLRSGNSTSCGRCSLVKHGYAHNHHPEPIKKSTYRIWCGIIQRCTNPNATHYKSYGGRGVLICERWREFENFIADMGTRPTVRHSIERVNVNGNYDPSNCKWALPDEQARNRRNVRQIEYNGEVKTIADWARAIKVSERCLGMRLRSGWSVEKALTTPHARKNPAPPPKPVI